MTALMQKTRVLIVDMNVNMRQLLSRVLALYNQFEVLGVASDYEIAQRKMLHLHIDVLIMDILSEESAVEFIRSTKLKFPSMRIVCFSGLTSKGSPVTLEILRAGAADYVHRPENLKNDEQGGLIVKRELIEHLSLAVLPGKCGSDKSQHVAKISVDIGKNRSFKTQKVDVLAIGASTGGPDVLELVLSGLIESPGVPIFIVQHMPKEFTSQLAERLSRVSKIPVVEAKHQMVVQTDHCYLAPGGQHMEVMDLGNKKIIVLNDNAPVNSCKPSVDVLYQSLAKVYRGNILAVILTGMGQDGFMGCRQIYNEGGLILVQDEETSLVWGMPGIVYQAGLTEKKISKNNMAMEISEVLSNCRLGLYGIK